VDRSTLRTAAVVGLGAAVASVVGGLVLHRALDDTPTPDGEFLLDEPGVYQEPVDGENADLSGRGVPRFELLDVDEQVVTLADFNDGPLVVNLWYSTCPPCARELADFAAVERDLRGTVQFVGVNPQDSTEVMLRFAGERGVEYPLLRDADRLLGVGLEIVNYPVTLFVDADGLIVRQTGAIDEAELRAIIEEVF
jgi:peroxiredoxin